MTEPGSHLSVMADEVVQGLAPKSGGTYVDGTFGAGGYSAALLKQAKCTVWGIDRDPLAQTFGEKLSQIYPGQITVLSGCYGDMEALLADVGVKAIDGITLDLGVSSMQIDDPGRGFSFRGDGPLDMRMGSSEQTAADVVNSFAEEEIANIIYMYGEERASRRIAHAIVEFRKSKPITGTGQLASLIRSVVSKSKDGIDPATRTFQALRIYVNDELGELDRGLGAAERLLVPGGRLAVVSFHSLEDRRVKTFLRTRSGDSPRPSRHLPDTGEVRVPTFKVTRKSGQKASPQEVAVNPRARSARLRVAERTAAPAQVMA
ncbi:MAG: 16S rRNA (cytosine(1402)-N(4))-methyltransferase RsmH [Rhodospirillales bacterium]|nr:16S rRNA (cytosine(1402)-N(4))-methyltransferase RsmH [Rhodospirillales bacterium]